jgi:hypothetical protein
MSSCFDGTRKLIKASTTKVKQFIKPKLHMLMSQLVDIGIPFSFLAFVVERHRE